MRFIFRQILMGLLLLAGIALLSGYLWRHFDVSQIKMIGPVDATILVAIYLTSLFLNAVNISIIFRGLGYRTSSIKILAITLASGAATTLTPIKLGIPVRVFLYQRILKVPYSVGIMEIATETVLYFLTSFLFLLLPSRVYVERNFYGWAAGILIAGAIIAFILFRWALLRLEPEGRIARFLDSLRQAFLNLPRLPLRYLIWLIIGLPLFWVVCDSISWFFLNFISLVRVRMIDVIFVENISYLSSTLSMVPLGGIGVKDVVFSKLLAQTGVPEAASTAAVIVHRFLYTFCSLCLGAVVWFAWIRRTVLGSVPGERRDDASLSVEVNK